MTYFSDKAIDRYFIAYFLYYQKRLHDCTLCYKYINKYAGWAIN